MRLDPSDIDALRPIIAAAVHATLAELSAADAKLGEQLAYPEPQAAALLGVRSHVLGDARRRGEISARLLGKRYVYSRAALLAFLDGGGPRR